MAYVVQPGRSSRGIKWPCRPDTRRKAEYHPEPGRLYQAKEIQSRVHPALKRNDFPQLSFLDPGQVGQFVRSLRRGSGQGASAEKAGGGIGRIQRASL